MSNDTCPHCDAGQRGEPIPQKYIDAGYYRPGATHYSRTIGVEIRGVYDGVLYWCCPDCHGSWHRWPEGHQLRSIAERYMQAEQPPHWGEADIIGDYETGYA